MFPHGQEDIINTHGQVGLIAHLRQVGHVLPRTRDFSPPKACLYSMAQQCVHAASHDLVLAGSDLHTLIVNFEGCFVLNSEVLSNIEPMSICYQNDNLN